MTTGNQSAVKEYLLSKLMLIEVSKHVTIVTKNVACEEQRAVCSAQIVDAQQLLLRTAGGANDIETAEEVVWFVCDIGRVG